MPADVPPNDTWEVGCQQMEMEVENASGSPRRPWVTLIVGGQSGLAIGTDMQLSHPTPTDVLRTIGQTIRKPAIGRPHRPKSVVCAERALAESLAPGLAALGVESATGETPHLVEMLASLGQFLDTRRAVPGLLESPGTTPELVGRLFAAAAAYYRFAPWTLVADDLPIAVRVPDVSDRVAYVVVIGQAGKVRGLAVFRTPEALQIGLSATDPEEAMGLVDQEGLTFGTSDEIEPSDLAAVEKHGWQIAGPDAYPMPFIITRTGETRRPGAADLEWYEIVLWTLSHFLERNLAPALEKGEGVEATIRARLGDRPFVATYRYPPTIRRRTSRRRRP
jgi:hypothetical protein